MDGGEFWERFQTEGWETLKQQWARTGGVTCLLGKSPGTVFAGCRTTGLGWGEGLPPGSEEMDLLKGHIEPPHYLCLPGPLLPPEDVTGGLWPASVGPGSHYLRTRGLWKQSTWSEQPVSSSHAS